MSSMWNKFIVEYCRVGFLCENNDPNWLGWMPIGFIGLIFTGIVLMFFGLIIGTIFEGVEVAVLSIQDTFKKRNKYAETPERNDDEVSD